MKHSRIVLAVVLSAILMPLASPVLRAQDNDAFTRSSEQAREQVNNAESRLQNIEIDLRQRAGRTEVEPAALHQAAGALDAQAEALELDDIAAAARSSAISQTIEELQGKAQNAADGDAAVAQLQKAVQADQKTLQLLSDAHKMGSVADADVIAAEKNLAELQARLAMQRQSAFDASGGNEVTTLRSQLIDLRISQEELHAKLKFIHDQLNRLQECFNGETQAMEDAQRDLDLARQTFDSLRKNRLDTATRP
jgi:chromosome segregation ATPase